MGNNENSKNFYNNNINGPSLIKVPKFINFKIIKFKLGITVDSARCPF